MSVGRDTGFNLTAALAPVFFTLAVTPFYLHLIGPDRFGILAICWTIVGALGFASLGMGPALTYRLAQMDGETPTARSNHVWMALVIGFSASLLGAILVLTIARGYFQQFASLPLGLKTEVWTSLPFLAVLLPFGTLSGILNGALQGRKRFGALSAVSLFSAGVVAIAPLLAAFLVSPNLPVLVLAMAIANAVVLLVQLCVCARVVPLQFPTRLSDEHIRSLVGYGAWMSGTALVSPFLLLFDRFVIGALRGASAIAIYSLAFNVLQGLLLLPAGLSSALLPRIAGATDQEVRQLQSVWLTWLNGILTPSVIAGIALNGPFFRLWIGRSLGSEASPVAAILLVGCWAHGIGHIPSTVVVGRGRPDLLTKLLLAILVPYLVVLYLATLHYGVVGAGVAWTVRAAFDPILFLYTRPHRSDMRAIGSSALLVLCAMAIALMLGWTSALYWAAMALIIATACYFNRHVLVTSLKEFRKSGFRNALRPFT